MRGQGGHSLYDERGRNINTRIGKLLPVFVWFRLGVLYFLSELMHVRIMHSEKKCGFDKAFYTKSFNERDDRGDRTGAHSRIVIIYYTCTRIHEVPDVILTKYTESIIVISVTHME